MHRYFDVAIPADLELTSGVWSTISVLSAPKAGGGFRITVYLDGYLLYTIAPAQDFLRMTSGMVTVGDADDGFLGWIDDFKIIARAPNPEVICNHARGTLVGVDQVNALSSDRNEKRAAAYPQSSHTKISNLLPGLQFAGYACERPIANPSSALDFYDHGHYPCLGQTRRRPEGGRRIEHGAKLSERRQRATRADRRADRRARVSGWHLARVSALARVRLTGCRAFGPTGGSSRL